LELRWATYPIYPDIVTTTTPRSARFSSATDPVVPVTATRPSAVGQAGGAADDPQPAEVE
jgi:hypothetical protein